MNTPLNRPDAPTLSFAGPTAGPEAYAPPDIPSHLAPQLPDYQVTQRLGEGGMGVVWKAVQLSTRRAVALKLLSPGSFNSRRARTRFEREVEMAARLEHPNIARVYDSGIHRGVHYYAMELIDGVHLDTHAAMYGLDKRQVLTLVRDACDAVQHAHQRGVIHRDLKPSNILVTRPPQSRACVVDFGLAKFASPDDDSRQLSLDGQVAGTPAYMSPEQAAGRTDLIDTRTDIYSLGVILYRLLTGQSPHDLSGSSFTVLKRIAEGDIRRPRTVTEDASRTVDRELESLLLKAMAKDPRDRYASAAAFAQDIDNYLTGEPLAARRATTFYFLRKRMWKHRVPVAAAAAAGMVLLGSAGGIYGYLYAQPATLHVRSNPDGARILVDGIEQPGCGTTPTRLTLGPGAYTLTLDRGAGYVPERRTVHVAWGRATGDVSEPVITLQPAFQTVVVTTEPEGVPVEIREEDTNLLRHGFRTPAAVAVDRGRYTIHFGFAGDPADAPGEKLQIQGDAMPLTIKRSNDQNTKDR